MKQTVCVVASAGCDLDLDEIKPTLPPVVSIEAIPGGGMKLSFELDELLVQAGENADLDQLLAEVREAIE